MTNFEKIKSMTIDEMATFLSRFDCLELCKYEGACKTFDNCETGLKKYLEMEVK